MSFSRKERMSGIGVAHLGQPVDAEAEGEPRPDFGVDADGREDGRVDHAAPAELDPAGVRAGAAPLAQADRAGDLELGGRLGEREIGRAQAGLHPRPKYASVKTWIVPARSPNVMSRSTTRPSIWLNTGRWLASGVSEPEALARHDRVDGQRVVGNGLFHQVDLHGRGVGAQEHRLGLADIEVHRVVHAPGRVRRRHVQRLEVVPVGLRLRAFGHGEPHADEHVFERRRGPGSPRGEARGPARTARCPESPRSGRGGPPRGQRRARVRASSTRRAASRSSKSTWISLIRRPASLRTSGSRRPRARWALVRTERLPSNSVSTEASASVEEAPSMARAPSPAIWSMSISAFSVTMRRLAAAGLGSGFPKCYVARATRLGAGGVPRSRPPRRPPRR